MLLFWFVEFVELFVFDDLLGVELYFLTPELKPPRLAASATVGAVTLNTRATAKKTDKNLRMNGLLKK